MSITVTQALEIERLASLVGTARVIRFRAEKGLITTVTHDRAKERRKKAEADLLLYLESLRDPDEGIHPDNARAMDYWNTLVQRAEERKC